MTCECKFDADPSDPDEDTAEKSWHFKRACLSCGGEWFGLHCPHDGYQNPCPHCEAVPTPVAGASMSTHYEIHLRQRSGKWVPQCEHATLSTAMEAWDHMLAMKRTLRLVKIENGVRTVVIKHEAAK